MEEQENAKFTIKDASVKNGIMLGLVFIIFTFILIFTDNIGNQLLGLLNYVLMIVFIVIGHNSYKSNGTGFMSFGQGLGIGTLIITISSLVSNLVMYIYTSFVDDSFLRLTKDAAIAQMESRGTPQDQIDQALEMTSWLYTAEFIFPMAIVFSIFFGFILSLIITIFTKKEDPSLKI